MKSIFSAALMLVACSPVFASEFPMVAKIETKADIAIGFDKISNTTVSDCTYVLDDDGMNVVVGVNSKSARYNNVTVRIPKEFLPNGSLPLPDGFSTKGRYNVSYSDGYLTAQREKTGEGSANEFIFLTLQVSPDLQKIVRAEVTKNEGATREKSKPIAQMQCGF